MSYFKLHNDFAVIKYLHDIDTINLHTFSAPLLSVSKVSFNFTHRSVNVHAL